MSYKHRWDLEQGPPELNLLKNVGLQTRGYMRCHNLECTVQRGFILTAIEFKQQSIFYSFFPLFCIISFFHFYHGTSLLVRPQILPQNNTCFSNCQKHTSPEGTNHPTNAFLESDHGAFMWQTQS